MLQCGFATIDFATVGYPLQLDCHLHLIGNPGGQMQEHDYDNDDDFDNYDDHYVHVLIKVMIQ